MSIEEIKASPDIREGERERDEVSSVERMSVSLRVGSPVLQTLVGKSSMECKRVGVGVSHV